MKHPNNPTAEYVKSLLYYNPITGDIKWLVARCNAIKKNQIAGTLGTNGYIVISIDKVQYGAHRLAWLWMTGKWPEGFIDHKDGNPGNNCWSNLRLSTCSQNLANCRIYANNTSGYKGVYWEKSCNKWVAKIQVKTKRIYLGCFSTKEEAAKEYNKAALKYFGEYANLNLAYPIVTPTH